MSDEAFATELRTQAIRVFEQHPELPHTWHKNGELVIEALSDSGFDVALHPDRTGIVVSTSVGFHEHCEGSPCDAVEAALGLDLPGDIRTS